MIKSFEELSAIQESCSARLAGKFRGEGGKRAIVLCGGTGCLSSNSAEIREKFSKIIEEKGLSDKVTVNQVGCFGFCSQGPFVKIYPEDTLYRMVHLDDVEEIVEKDIIGGEVVEHLLYVDPATEQKVAKQDDITFYKKQVRIALHGCGSINPEDINEALGDGAFQGLAKALKMDRADVIKEILDSGLRGRGGGGFPTGRKWQFAYAQPDGEKYVVCNGDEGDPGAFMDRSILEGNPLAVIEGMIIAGYAIGAQNGYFYVRAEYPIAVNRLKIAIRQAEEIGLLGDNILGTDFSFRRCTSAWARARSSAARKPLCSIPFEGQRGDAASPSAVPGRQGPVGTARPSSTTSRRWPTCPTSCARARTEFARHRHREDPRAPRCSRWAARSTTSVWLRCPWAPRCASMIYDIGGGIPGGKEFKAIQTGGPSGGCLTATGSGHAHRL